MEQAGSTTAGRIGTTVIGAVAAAPISYVVGRAVEKWGVLDPTADVVGSWLKINVPPGAVGWTLAILLFAAFYGLILWKVWRPRHVYHDRYHEPLREQARADASFEAEVIPAAKLPKASQTNELAGRIAAAGESMTQGLRSGPAGDHSLTQALRDVRGADPERYTAHIEFLSTAQRSKAERLRDVFELAGWSTNYGSTPYDRFSARYATGIEVTAVNGQLSANVAGILESSGFGPAKVLTEETQIRKDNPKWPFVQRTVRLVLGQPPE
jgi:hypothetical protein